MNNEPVAWMETYKGEPNNLDWDKNNLYCEGEFHNVVPLYTHSVKEITDKDIDIALYVADITLNNLSDGDISMERIKAFVRTILRKAQEK